MNINQAHFNKSKYIAKVTKCLESLVCTIHIPQDLSDQVNIVLFNALREKRELNKEEIDALLEIVEEREKEDAIYVELSDSLEKIIENLEKQQKELIEDTDKKIRAALDQYDKVLDEVEKNINEIEAAKNAN